MTKLFSISFLFFLLSCGDHNVKQTLSPPDKKDINEIIETIIYKDSSLFIKNILADSGALPLSVDLRKLKVIITDTTLGIPPPIDHTLVSIFDLSIILVDNQRFFNKVDTSYFLFQNGAIIEFTIDSSLANKLVSIKLSDKQRLPNQSQSVKYYDLTIPLFSRDNEKAYIELTTNCPGCGGATAFYLEKINSKWKVVGMENRWRN